MKDYVVYLVMITSHTQKTTVMCHKCMYLYASGVYSRDQLHCKFTLAFKGEGAVQKKKIKVWEVLDFLQFVPSPAPPVLYCVNKNSRVHYILKIFKHKQNTRASLTSMCVLFFALLVIMVILDTCFMQLSLLVLIEA